MSQPLWRDLEVDKPLLHDTDLDAVQPTLSRHALRLLRFLAWSAIHLTSSGAALGQRRLLA